MDTPRVANLVDLAVVRAQALGEKTLYHYLVDGDDQVETLSYAGLDRRSRAIGAELQACAERHARFLVIFPPGLEYISAFWACLYAGVCAVPLYPPMNPRHMGRLLAVMRDCDASGILTTTPLARMMKAWIQAQGVDDRHFRWVTVDSIADAAADHWQRPAFAPGDLAFLQYTSGSTGEPKGVKVGHDGLLHNSGLISAAYRGVLDDFGYEGPGRSVSWLPPYHDLGLIDGVLQPLYAGRDAVLMSPLAFLEKPLRWLRAISRYRATTSGGPCFGYDLCLRKVSDEQAEGLDLASWGCAYNAAEPIRRDVVEGFATRFAPHGFDARSMHPVYGLAEATLIVATESHWGAPSWVSVDGEALNAHRIEPVAGTPTATARHFISHGRPLGDTELRIVDPDTGRECRPQCVGEVWIAGRSVALGYWGRELQTEQAFNARFTALDGTPAAGPWFRSGDLGFLQPDGRFFITGRLKDVIILRGKNHYPQDIEFTVSSAGECLRVGCAAAVAVQQEDGEKLVVVQEVRAGATVEQIDAALARARAAVIAEHGIVPWELLAVAANQIPKTSSGKLRRFQVREQYLDDSLQPIRRLRSVEPVSAEDAARAKLRRRLENRMLGWIAHYADLEVLSIDREQPFESFGIDSVAVVELACELETVLERKIPDHAVHEFKTIAAMADYLAEFASQPEPAPAAASSSDAAHEPALSFALPQF